MKNEKAVAALTKSINSLTKERATLSENLASVTGKLNEAQTKFAEMMGLPAPSPVRVAGMAKGSIVAKGPNETAFNAKYGRCRLQDKTIKTFNLSGTREEMIGAFAKLIESRKAIKTVTGWQLAVNVPAAKVNAAKPALKGKGKPVSKPAKPAKKAEKAKPAAVKKVKKAPAPAKKSTVSAKALKLAAEARPTPASQVAIMG